MKLLLIMRLRTVFNKSEINQDNNDKLKKIINSNSTKIEKN